MRALRWSLPVVVLAAALLTPRPAYPQDEWETMRQRFEGTWVLAVPRSEGQATIDRAVNQTAEAMNFFVRGIARPMLAENTPLNRTIRFEFSDAETEQVTVTFVDTGATYTTRPGRPRRLRSLDGSSLRVTQRFREGRLEQVFEAGQGTRWNVYTSTGEDTMRCDATTNGDMLPQAMHFALDYRRQ